MKTLTRLTLAALVVTAGTSLLAPAASARVCTLDATYDEAIKRLRNPDGSFCASTTTSSVVPGTTPPGTTPSEQPAEVVTDPPESHEQPRPVAVVVVPRFTG